MKHLTFKYVKIHPKAVAPKKIAGDLAFDLSVVADSNFELSPTSIDKSQPPLRSYLLQPGERKTFNTGLKMAISPGYGIVIKDRSGMAVKTGIHVLAGVIDNSYRGEILVCLLNTSNNCYEVIEGDRIAQAIIIEEYKIDFVEEKELDATERGEKGFGASGR